MAALFLENLLQLLAPLTLMLLVGGLVMGLVFGALPGLSATTGVATMLPLTYAMAPDVGIATLVAIYIGGVSGGLVSATLLRVPGTPSSIATTFDSYPLARRGQAVKALATGMVASFIGGLFSLVVLVLVAPTLARMALRFGPHEYTALTLAAFTLVIVLSPASLSKGLASCFIGLAISLIGFAPIGGTIRFTFGSIDLLAGVGIIPFMVGLFAISQMLREILNPSPPVRLDLKIAGVGVRLREIWQNGVNLLRSCAIGVGVGVLPGVGGSASNLIAYGAARQASRRPQEFGKGSLEGIYASESANNASVGGALLPLITLGIPGDGVTAILIGGFMIHGLQPGPLLFRNEPDVVAMIYAAFLLSITLLLIVQLGTLRLFPRVLLVPRRFLLPSLIVLMMIGAYSAGNNPFDIWLMLAMGVLGYVLESRKYPLGPMVLGFVLGPILETNLRRALMFADGDWGSFLNRPIAVVLLSVAVLLLVLGLVRHVRRLSSARAG